MNNIQTNTALILRVIG
jgi:hypothetical protein